MLFNILKVLITIVRSSICKDGIIALINNSFPKIRVVNLQLFLNTVYRSHLAIS